MSFSFAIPLKKKRRQQSHHPSSSSSSSTTTTIPFPSLSPSFVPPSDGADRLTALPDALRLHILTLLPLKSAIRTSALSSNWLHLWKLRHPNPHPSNLYLTPPIPCSPSSFVRHVTPILSGPHKRLDSLHLAFHPSSRHLPDLHSWLDYSAACRIEDLSLDLSPAGPTRRRGVTTLSLAADFSSLARLTLTGFHLSSPPSYFKKLSALEVLNLYRVNLTDAALRRIVSNCPLLRTLDLRRCPDLKRVVVPGPRLKLSNVTVVDCPKVVEITVCAPNFRKFHFGGNFLSEYNLGHVLRLEDVYMSCGGPGSGLPESNWVEALGELCHVRVLTLCSLSLQYMVVAGANAIGEFRNFQYLRELQLLMVTMTESNLMDIYSFFSLCRCSSLEKLFIQLPTHMHDPYMENFLEVIEEEPLVGVFTNLKVIKINGFKGHQYEMRLVRFLLWKAIFLESLIIVAPQEPMRGESSKSAVNSHSHMLHFLRVQFHLMEKLSANAQIVVREHDDYWVRPTHFEVYCKV